MDYHIELEYQKGKWRKIASFESVVERNYCLENMQEKYSDCTFRPISRTM